MEPDAPLQARLDRAPAQQDLAILVAQIEAHLAASPDDARGWELLAPIYMRTGRVQDAVAARSNILRLAFDRRRQTMVSMLRATMPMDAPGSLTLQEYTDVVTYILELNEIPAGNTELAGEESRLQEVTLEYRR